ncbi:PTS system fructose IIA component [Aerococcus sp. Group 1]|uniref:PTS sugar transporter subunit IIA n=1 Tax=Aerococcus urinae (strain CCUG 59500 / ACS-120-V-Col10a) TaxID=2976812 RepID=UPI000200EBCF|nr:PTS sugar transporter subunit IIA [Aerococcus sp. Group 1]AEA01486.1 PTS system fructose IIA component [Aerococcus sp. Group 1]
MVGLLLISHGRMAEGMIDSLALIGGVDEHIDYCSLVAGQDFETFKEDVRQSIKALDSGDGVLVFVDLYGASPFNATLQIYRELLKENIHIRVITGMNLPMLLEANAMKSALSLGELTNMVLSSGQESIQEPISEIVNNEVEEEGDDY